MPTRTTGVTFGFEAEYESGGIELGAALASRGLTPSDEFHGYHCDCHDCCSDVACVLGEDGYAPGDDHTPFYLQNDSTCSGEVISRPRRAGDRWQDDVAALCQAAIDVDAEPGTHAGLHVHVGRQLLGADAARARGLLTFTFALMEPLLVTLAAGRFPTQRTMNRSIRGDLAWYFQDRGLSWEGAVRAGFRTNETALEDLWQIHRELDRHSNLNVSTRLPTVEFRLWNSTRAAWRMELAIGLSVAFADRAALLTMTSALEEGWSREAALVHALNRNGYDRTLELAIRQLTYLHRTGGTWEQFAA